MRIKLKNISKKFGTFEALAGVNLDIHSGELLALLGPSGSGKTTLLRIISGLEFPDFGTILFDDQKDTSKRSVGFVFQHYALFRHMTVFENIAFGLRVRDKKTRPSEKEIKNKVGKLLELVHLTGLQDRYPLQLSGGQRQRVALARALAIEPQMLLLDEPFGALDAKVRKELRRWMRKLHDELNITSVFVTHDQEEAMEVADRVVVMNCGRIEQIGTPEEVWHNPQNAFVYSFLGNYNEFEGWIDQNEKLHLLEREFSAETLSKLEQQEEDLPWYKKIFKSETECDDEKSKAKEHKKIVKVFSRAHETEIVKSSQNDETVVANIIHINPAGSFIKIELERKDGGLLQVEINPETYKTLNLEIGLDVYIRPKKYRIFSS